MKLPIVTHKPAFTTREKMCIVAEIALIGGFYYGLWCFVGRDAWRFLWAVSSNASAGDPTHAVSGTGTAAPPSPALTLLQKPRPFPATRVGKRSGAQTLRITNGGGSPLAGLRVAAGGRAKRDFILKQPALKILSPGAATTFKATFRPRDKGSRKAVLEVRSNAPVAKAPLAGRGNPKK